MKRVTLIGKTLAHYEILEKLGSGGMGDVYRARDTKLGRDVAIKVLPEEFSKDAERRKRFQREAQAIAALKHPNIVTIHSVEEINGVHFITMELVEGGTLAASIPPGGLGLDAFFVHAITLADALSSAHEQNISHRDLKPANIMFDRDGRLKVLDFGLAKLLSPSTDIEAAPTVVQGSDTAVGQIMGTAAYMSPEQAEGKPIDHRSDIFSLGIIYYEMATGQRPFTGDTQISTISSILKDTPKHISELKREIPRHVGRIVNHCLEKDAERRFQSAKDIRNDLEGLKKEIDSGELSVEMESASAVNVPSSTSTTTQNRPWMRWAIPAAVVAAAALVMAFWPRGGGGDLESLESALRAAKEITAAVGELDVEEDRRKMAVVLPFENLGPPEDAYFAAGMTEEITTRLAAVSGLGVISRTSATQYDRTGKTMTQIGEDLGVDFVLEGSVRWAKNTDGTGRVRITPQLVRVSDDTHVWSQTYDRDMDDIFEVQTDIASRVIDQLGVTLMGGERERLANAPTQNMEAYKVYMQAKDLHDPDFAADDSKKVELFTRATVLDPDFVEAWAALSIHHSGIYNGPLDKTDARLSKARDALLRAEALDPNHPETHMARGMYHYYGFREYDIALEQFLTATELVPNDARARAFVGYIYRRKGKLEECIENLKRACVLNPQDPTPAVELAGTYRAMREYERSVENFDRGIALRPDDDHMRFDKARVMLDWKGDIEFMDRTMDDISGSSPFWFAVGKVAVHVMRREYASALAALDNMETTDEVSIVAKAHRRGLIEFLAHGPEKAGPSLRHARAEIDRLLELAPGNTLLREWRAHNLAMLGEEGAAVAEAKLIVDLTAKDQYLGPAALETLAQVYAMVGREQEAIDLLRRLLKMNYSDAVSPYKLQLEPAYDRLRDNPEFQALLPGNT